MNNNYSRDLGFGLMGIGLLLLALGIFGLTSPDEFRASARIAITRPEIDEVFVKISPDVETVKSEVILSNVVSGLQLTAGQKTNTRTNETLNYTHAIATLRDRIEVRAIPNTRLLEISVIEKSPAQAARCANTIAYACKMWTGNTRRKLAQARIAELEKGLAIITQEVAAAEAKLGQLKVSLNIPSPEPSAQELRAKWPDYDQAKLQLEHRIRHQDALGGKIKWERHDLLYGVLRSDCEIVEVATPPTTPLHPKKTRGVISLIAGFVCCGWGLKCVKDSRTARIT